MELYFDIATHGFKFDTTYIPTCSEHYTDIYKMIPTYISTSTRVTTVISLLETLFIIQSLSRCVTLLTPVSDYVKYKRPDFLISLVDRLLNLESFLQFEIRHLA